MLKLVFAVCNTCVENCPAEILSLDKEADAIKKKEATSLEGYHNKQEIKATIEEIKDLADDTKEYTFKFDDPAKVDYQAGQFILVKIEDNPEMYRAYSISSYNEDSNRLSVTIKKMEDGYGTTIIFEEFAKGDQIKLKGPMGDELVVDKTADEVLLVAGGIGVTPFVPIARDLI
jgi:NAD(P)H-flavin reductase